MQTELGECLLPFGTESCDFPPFWGVGVGVAQQHPVGHGLIEEVSRSHNDTPHSLGLLWTSDQLVADTST